MKILVLGSGGREHSIAVKFASSKQVEDVIVSPGNGGIATEFTCVNLPDFASIARFVQERKIDLVFVGPEQPLSEGVVDYLTKEGITSIGPSQKASQIEASKAYAKNLMRKYNVPTADYRIFNNFPSAKTYLQEATYPLVLKADGLAAGKGVVIVNSQTEAVRELQDFMMNSKFGTAGETLVIEEFLSGWETSIFAFCDGDDFVSTIFSMDHKQLQAGDKGPNTGGMGAIAPIKLAEDYRQEVESKIFKPILQGLKEEGHPFTGVLYCGLMITSQGAKVIEFNCRFGDPETQVILPLLETDLVDICLAIKEHRINDIKLEWKDEYAVNIVCASAGYPGKYAKGEEIELPAGQESSKIYYAGVRKSQGKLLTNGGRVLSITTIDKNRECAIQKGYSYSEKISFSGKIIRSDIGLRPQQ